MRKLSLHRLESRRGVAAVEFAFVLPMLVILMFGVWEVGRLVGVVQVMSNACREAGRQTSSGSKTVSEIKQVVVDYLAENDITILPTNVTVTNISNASNLDPKAAVQLDRFEVSVTVPIANVRWLSSGFFSASGDLTTKAQWYSMNDVPLDVPTDLPVE